MRMVPLKIKNNNNGVHQAGLINIVILHLKTLPIRNLWLLTSLIEIFIAIYSQN